MLAILRVCRLSQSILAGVTLLSGLTAASADDLYRNRTGLPQGAPGHEQLVPATPGANRCAAYGAGFVPLQGTDTCVKLGGHVRVEFSTGLRTSNDSPRFALPTSVDGPLPVR